MKKTNVLVIADTQEDIISFRDKNKQFIPGLKCCTSRYMEGSSIVIRFVTVYALEYGVCGTHADVIINISTVDTERLRECVMSRLQ